MNVRLCQCGCGEEVKIGRLYIQWHHKRGKPGTLNGRKPIINIPQNNIVGIGV